MVSATANAARPDLYAVGTLTTLFSLFVIALVFGILYIIEKRRGLLSLGGHTQIEEDDYTSSMKS